MVRIPVGKEFFDAIRREQDYYVDKTEILYQLVEEARNEVTLFTRPRRFGKTLMMSMMECFFSIQRGDSRDLFEGLDIMKHEAFCAAWMNQYPVLFVTLKGIEALSFEEAFSTLKAKLSEVCIKHKELLENRVSTETDRMVFKKLMKKEADLAEIKGSLGTIMRMMHDHYGKQVILLIDEYDVPLAKASERDTEENGYYQKMLDVIRGMFDAAIKTNEFLKFAVITGCLRIAKESIFTGTNNFKSYSVLDEEFSECFGFTQTEVDKLLSDADRTDKAETIREWYNGYVFGNTPVYCPWDVVNYVATLLKIRNAKPKNYWKNTSHNGILLTFVKRTDFDVSDKFETLMNGGTLLQTISDELTYNTLHASEENLWSVLLMTGYLTKADPDAEGDTVELKIPNAEISNIFEETVVSHFKDTLALDRTKQTGLMEALWSGDEEKATRLMTDILFDTISYHDYHENYYHAFLTGIISGLGYAVRSNQENGLGRSDIDVREKRKRRAMLLEAKKSDKAENMLKDALDGMRQIEEKEYLKGFDGFESVICYGISFFQKKALVKKLGD
ncbi:MAG: AAA family ATPase [Lachnospiraceae bacterium]|nr:AAA family ATPase [Lachnospiraceae bacterium]